MTLSDYLPYLVFLGAAVGLLGIASYIRDMFRGDVKPNRVSWLLWSIAPFIGTAAAISDGVTLAVLPVFMAGFGPLLVLIASFINKNAYWKTERFDYGCSFLSLLALSLWWVTNIPEVAILFSMASDGFAAIPTLTKSWRFPDTERAEPFLAGLFCSLTSFAAVNAWQFSSVAFPIYLILMNIALIFAIYRRKIFKNQARAA
jgi:hypothetical protein